MGAPANPSGGAPLSGGAPSTPGGAPVYIAGVGVISSIGDDSAASLDALSNGRAGIGPMRLLRSTHRDELPVAEVPHTNAELASMAGLQATLPRTALLSAIAAREALRGIDTEGLRVGLISANTVGGMDLTEDFYPGFFKGGRYRLRDVVHHECGAITELVADRLGIHHHVSTISTACSSSANAIFMGARLIRQGHLDVVVAGGADALSRFTLNGFNTLMILDKEPCHPMDENRKGLNLGEGAGYVVLVSERLARPAGSSASGSGPLARLTGWCNANDAYHQTASSPEGTGSYLAMKGALAKAGLSPSDIGYINLHGTGTQNNDIAEGTAVKTLFDPVYPPLSSTKSFTGHTLGGSGGIEAVFSVLSLQGGYIYPNLRWHTPMKGLPFVPAIEFVRGAPVRHVLSNSFGFGGNCTSLIFSHV